MGLSERLQSPKFTGPLRHLARIIVYYRTNPPSKGQVVKFGVKAGLVLITVGLSREFYSKFIVYKNSEREVLPLLKKRGFADPSKPEWSFENGSRLDQSK